jgi:DNA repair protein RadC
MIALEADRLGPVDPPYDGLRERASRFGLAALEDVEALELFLARSFSKGARTWAQVLLRRWGSLDRVLCADVADLQEVLGPSAAVDLKLLHEATLRIMAGSIVQRELIPSWSALLAYIRVGLAGRSRERFRVLFLDKRNRLIIDEVMGEGTIDHAPVYPRELVRRALQLDASALILVHNHPSGEPTPSQADISVTAEIVEACRHLRITVHDHLIVAGEEVTSFKALGLI